MNFFKASKSPALGIAVPLLLILCAALAWGHFQPFGQKAQGFYLERGGLGYVEIERNIFSGLKIANAHGHFAKTPNGFYEFNTTPRLEKNRLIIKNAMSFGPSEGKLPSIGMEFYYILVPSSSVPGDWDLVACAYRSLDEKSEKINDEALPLLKNPIPSFLHRAGDKRIADYFAFRLADKSTEALKLAELLTAAHRDDPYFTTLKIDALLGVKDTQGLEKELARFHELSRTSKDPFLAYIHDITRQRTLEAQRLSKEGLNAHDFINELVSDTTGLESRLSQIGKIQKFHDYYVPMTSLINDQSPTNFLTIQTMIKVNTIEASFQLLQGGFSQAIELLSASERVGWLIGCNRADINQLISLACRSIALSGFKTAALNACHSEADINLLWKALEAIEREGKLDQGKIAYPWQPIDINDGKATESIYPQDPDLVIRRKIFDNRFAQVKVATAVRAHQLKTGALPKSATDLAPLMSALPQDPFSSGTLQCLPSPDAFVSYGVGPDLKDNQATIEYDPTNGTMSTGDIVSKIPRERDIPFPAAGVHASNATELHQIFPNGLPADPFADTKGKSLGVTSTEPVIVYSYGPDCNEVEARDQGERYLPTVSYDPTNGTSSAGDLFIKIPQ